MKTIGVHSGIGHADDVLGVCLLQFLDEYKDSRIIRSRKPEDWAQCDVLLDVGAEYNHEKRRYDHHQNGYDVKFPGSGVPCAACGLIWLHYGQEVIKKLVTENGWVADLTDDVVDLIWRMQYHFFIEEIDALDNGVAAVPADKRRRYGINTSISCRIARMRAGWKSTEEEDYEAFIKALDVMKKEFLFFLKYVCVIRLETRQRVRAAFEQAENRIIMLGKCEKRPFFQPELVEIEKETGREGEILYVIMERPESWDVQAVSVGVTMKPRAPIPFRDLPPEQQTAAVEKEGIKDMVFIHKTGFLATFRSKESAVKMANFAVKRSETEKEEHVEAE